MEWEVVLWLLSSQRILLAKRAPVLQGSDSISQLSLCFLAIRLVQKTGTFFAASPQVIALKKRQI